jgi:hypothetical protein
MLQKIKVVGFLVSLFGCVVATSGCFALVVGAAAGVSGYAWAKGALIKQQDVSVKQTRKAVVKAISDLELHLKSDTGDRLTARIRAVFSDGAGVTIDITAITEESCLLKIRVGWLGDRLRSELILGAIEDNL